MVLFFQIKHCPDDFFEDVISKDNFLSTTLAWFFANVEGGFLTRDFGLHRSDSSRARPGFAFIRTESARLKAENTKFCFFSPFNCFQSPLKARPDPG